jgi:hypothetical protein
MKNIVQVRGHSDGVSGLYVFDDGTRVHWTEGRSSYMEVVYPNGGTESVEVSQPHPVNVAIEAFYEGPEDLNAPKMYSGQMTTLEEKTFNKIMGWKGSR